MMSVWVTNRRQVRVSTLEQASGAVQQATVKVGSSRWYGERAGLVLDAEGEIIARVSYNGRVWEYDPRDPWNVRLQAKEIFVGITLVCEDEELN